MLGVDPTLGVGPRIRNVAFQREIAGLIEKSAASGAAGNQGCVSELCKRSNDLRVCFEVQEDPFA
jgi:hypothetical protein